MSSEGDGDETPVSRVSGFYLSRPSIARLVSEAVPGRAVSGPVRLGVLSEHELYCDANGSIVGVFIVTASLLPIDQPMLVELELPWGEQLKLLGTVEWLRDIPKSTIRQRPGMGVRFELVEGQRLLLGRAMRLRRPIHISQAFDLDNYGSTTSFLASEINSSLP